MTELFTPDFDWLMTPTGSRLHHVTMGRAEAECCEELGGIYDGDITFDCGEKATTAWVPGWLSRCRRILGLPPDGGVT